MGQIEDQRIIEARGCFHLLLRKLAKTGQDKCAHLFNLFVDDIRRELRNTPAVLLSVWVASASALSSGSIWSACIQRLPIAPSIVAPAVPRCGAAMRCLL